jgi:transposase
LKPRLDGPAEPRSLPAWAGAQRGFIVLPQKWVVERTFGWLSKNRRMSEDYERKVQISETLIELAMIRLLIACLGWRPSGHSQPPPT